MKAARIFLLILIGSACLGLMDSPAVSRESKLQGLQSRLKQEKEKLEQLRAGIRKKETELSRVGRREHSLLANLEQIDNRLKVKEKELKVLQWNREINQNQIQDLDQKIESAGKRLAKQQPVLSGRLRALYKGGVLFPLKAIFSAGNFNGLLQRIKYIETVTAYDATLFREYRRRVEDLQNQKDNLFQIRQNLLNLEKETLGKKKEINEEKKEKADFLKKLKREKKLTLQARKELSRSSQDMTGLILNLEKKLELGEGLNFAESRGYLMPPVPGKFLNRFGKTRDRKYQTYIVYNGVDIRSSRGTPVRAVFDGKVLFTGTLEGYGNLIIIGHGEDYHSLYGHLDEIITRVGKRVRQGQIIGRSGDTGSLNGETLYFEIRYKGQPIDPVRWFRVAKK